jgi:hypothetical protein
MSVRPEELVNSRTGTLQILPLFFEESPAFAHGPANCQVGSAPVCQQAAFYQRSVLLSSCDTTMNRSS